LHELVVVCGQGDIICYVKDLADELLDQKGEDSLVVGIAQILAEHPFPGSLKHGLQLLIVAHDEGNCLLDVLDYSRVSHIQIWKILYSRCDLRWNLNSHISTRVVSGNQHVILEESLWRRRGAWVSRQVRVDS
jgi:hypothetical protein